MSHILVDVNLLKYESSIILLFTVKVISSELGEKNDHDLQLKTIQNSSK